MENIDIDNFAYVQITKPKKSVDYWVINKPIKLLIGINSISLLTPNFKIAHIKIPNDHRVFLSNTWTNTENQTTWIIKPSFLRNQQ